MKNKNKCLTCKKELPQYAIILKKKYCSIECEKKHPNSKEVDFLMDILNGKKS